MKSQLTACLIILINVSVFSIMSNAQLTDGKAELTRLRDTYSKESKKLTDEEMSSITGAQEYYLQTLKKLEANYQAQGNLDMILLVRTEKERFEKDRVITSKHMVQAIPDLQAAQKTYSDMTSKTPLAYARRIMTLITMYDSNLLRLQTQITKEGDIPTAQEIRKERDNIQTLPEFVSAKAIIQQAEAAAKTAAVAVVPTPATNVQAKISGPEKTAKKYSGKPEVQIHKRFKELLSLVQDQKWEKARDYVEPEFTKTMGVRVVDMILQLKFGIFRMGDGRANIDIQIDSITVDGSGLTAALVPELVINNQKRPMERLDWAEIDGDWYIKFSQNDIRQQNQGGGNEQQGRGKKHGNVPSRNR